MEVKTIGMVADFLADLLKYALIVVATAPILCVNIPNHAPSPRHLAASMAEAENTDNYVYIDPFSASTGQVIFPKRSVRSSPRK